MGSEEENSNEKSEEVSSAKQILLEPLGRDSYFQIEERISYRFQNYDLLERSLTHRSIRGRGPSGDYERLEYLGDAVLDLAVAHLLLENHTELQEGDLSKMRAALVNTGSLADLARELNLSPFIRLSKGELANRGSERDSILADVVESLFGAIYRESGFDVALEIARKLFGEKVKTVFPRDPKTELQERLHTLSLGNPEYVLEESKGPEHAPTFLTSLYVDGKLLGQGEGHTKKASQQEAASEALRKLANG